MNDILPFFKSFIRAGFCNCDVVMYVRDVSKEIINYLDSIGVFVFKIPEKYNKTKITKVRWKMYIDFLKEKKNEYKSNKELVIEFIKFYERNILY